MTRLLLEISLSPPSPPHINHIIHWQDWELKHWFANLHGGKISLVGPKYNPREEKKMEREQKELRLIKNRVRLIKNRAKTYSFYFFKP